MKKLLLLGGSHSDIPLIKAAQELGYYVITSGNHENDLGHKYANQYSKEDFSNKEAMLQLALELKVDAICPCANDFAAITCSYISEKTGLGVFDSVQTSEIIHHKDKFRTFGLEHKLNIPNAKNYISFEDAINEIDTFTFPLIIKPVDLSGGKGVGRFDSYDKKTIESALQEAFKSSKSKRIVIEEFIEGSNHGITMLLQNKKVVFNFSDNEFYYLNKYLVSAASTPSNISDTMIEQIILESEKIAQILDLKDGIFHMQFIKKDDKYYIIEICRRPPGDLYVDFVKYATKFDYPKYIIECFTNKHLDNISQKKSDGCYIRHCIMGSKNGVLKDIVFESEIKKHIIDSMLWFKAGDEIEDYLTYKAGIVFLKFDSIEQMNKKYASINNLIRMEIE